MDSKYFVGAVDPHVELGISVCPIDSFYRPVFVDRDEYAARFAASWCRQESPNRLTAFRCAVRMELDRVWHCRSRGILAVLHLCHDLCKESRFSNQAGRADSARPAAAYCDSEKSARVGSGRHAGRGKIGRPGGIDAVVLCCDRRRVDSVFLWSRRSAVTRGRVPQVTMRHPRSQHPGAIHQLTELAARDSTRRNILPPVTSSKLRLRTFAC